MSRIDEASRYQQFIDGVKACLPTLLGYWAIALSCGAIGPSCGFSLWQIAAMSIFLYAGSAQLVFYSLITAHASILQITLSVALVNMRYVLTSAYIAKFFASSTLFEKLVGSALITDETFGVAMQYARQNDDKLPFYWLLGLNLTAWGNWIFATMMGTLIGTIIPNWAYHALNFSLVGMFIGLLILALQSSFYKAGDYFAILVAIVATIIVHKNMDKNVCTIIITLVSAISATIYYKWRINKASNTTTFDVSEER